MSTGEEQGGPKAERGNAVAMGLRDSLDHAVQAEPSQVIRHPPLGDDGGGLPGEYRELPAEISIGETTRKQTEPDQDVPQRQHAQISGAQCLGALSVDFHGTIQPMHRFFSHRAVVAEAFDFEKTSVGGKADLPQSR